MGNHDVAALDQIDLDTFNPLAKFAALWTQREMSARTRSFLDSLGQVEEPNGVTLVHGSPRDPVWEYLDHLDQAPENFARFTTSVCFVGHTHVPRVFTQEQESRTSEVIIPDAHAVVMTGDGARRIVNPGSVGQPRDGDPRAAFGFFDTASARFEYHRVGYDVSATQAKMKKAGLPKPLADRLVTLGL